MLGFSTINSVSNQATGGGVVNGEVLTLRKSGTAQWSPDLYAISTSSSGGTGTGLIIETTISGTFPNVITILDGGTGYSTDDVVTLVMNPPALVGTMKITVETITGVDAPIPAGGVGSITIVNGGAYSPDVSNVLVTTTNNTLGTGSGLEFSVSSSGNTVNVINSISNAGTGYAVGDTFTATGITGSFVDARFAVATIV